VKSKKQNSNLEGSRGGLAELKSRLMFVLIAILVYRLGAHIPVPGLDPERLLNFFNQQQNTIFGLFNMFSGGALSRVTVFAIGIMPYITASIIIQLFSVVVPTLEQIKKEGESGKRKLNQYTRYLTLIFSTLQSLGMARWLAGQHIALNPDALFYITAVVTLVTGTMFLMWLGEQMTEKGIGNGISLIIFSGIVSSMPNAMATVFQQIKEGQMQILSIFVIVGIMVTVTAFVVFMERGQAVVDTNEPSEAIDRYYELVEGSVSEAGAGGVTIHACDVHAENLRHESDVEPKIAQGLLGSARVDFEVHSVVSGSEMQVNIMDEAGAPLVGMPVMASENERRVFLAGRHVVEIPLGALELNAGKYHLTLVFRDPFRDVILNRTQGLGVFRVVASRSHWARIVRPALVEEFRS